MTATCLAAITGIPFAPPVLPPRLTRILKFCNLAAPPGEQQEFNYIHSTYRHCYWCTPPCCSQFVQFLRVLCILAGKDVIKSELHFSFLTHSLRTGRDILSQIDWPRFRPA